jgi:hypothetical protein
MRPATASQVCYGAVIMSLGILSVSATTSRNASTVCWVRCRRRTTIAMSGPGRPRPIRSTATAVCSGATRGFSFTGRIHEGVEQQILAAGLRYRHSGFNVLHFGYLAEGGALGGQSRITTIGSRAWPFRKLP